MINVVQILSKTTPYTLGKAACVCRKWRYTIRNPVFWRNACLKAWQVPGTLVLVVLSRLVSFVSIIDHCASFLKVSGLVENYKVLHLKYDGSWRKMWLLRPRIRTDGKIQFLMKMVKYCNYFEKYYSYTCFYDKKFLINTKKNILINCKILKVSFYIGRERRQT